MDSGTVTVTDRIVEFALEFNENALPVEVRRVVKRSFVDSVGCIVGGSVNPMVPRARDALSDFFGRPEASLLGQGTSSDLLHAALINGLAGAAYSFFDSYSSAHLHPGVAHTAALLAVAERTKSSGAELLSAYAAGLEIACRLTKAIALAPAEANIGWSIGAIISGVSSALSAGRLLGLSGEQSASALGIAASAAAGTRSELGTMTGALLFGHAAQVGVRSAILGSKGFTSSARSLEGKYGFASMFSKRPSLPALVEGLGERFESLSISYKPYPTDIAIHASIDAMLRLNGVHGLSSTEIVRIQVDASDIAASFCDRPSPVSDLDAKFSLQHWIAVAAVRGAAALSEGRTDVIQDPEVARLRSVTTMTMDPSLEWDAARVVVELRDGRSVEENVVHCTGSPSSPMSDSALQSKFLSQAEVAIGRARATDLVELCWNVDSLPDVSVLPRSAC
jgi:2-methylcitrate dehydratase PrpD